jgi:hypothetical protein
VQQALRDVVEYGLGAIVLAVVSCLVFMMAYYATPHFWRKARAGRGLYAAIFYFLSAYWALSAVCLAVGVASILIHSFR